MRVRAHEVEVFEGARALTKVLTNICLNRLTSARARPESYVGQWLPEPVLAGDRMLGPSETVEQRESVSIALLTLMERLSAKQHLAADRRRVEVDAAAARMIVEEFLAAALSGRTDSLVRMLTDDAIHVGDGGGVVFSLPLPISGALRVARFLRGLVEPSEAKWAMIGGRPVLFAAVANGVPALVLVVGDRVATVVSLDVTTDGIAAVHTQANPAKLERATRRWATYDRGEPLADSW